MEQPAAEETNGETSNKPMTEEERRALCQKMDQELDDFINSLERRRYNEGWPEDRWEEEMDKHPFFMKLSPDGTDMSPLAEGLAKLKYDPDENTPLELAQNYKEDGNFNFKHKNYRLAILGYTEGLKVKCNSPVINANLYNNRAACNWFLKNYRTAYFDSVKALSYDPKYSKARLRAAKCALEIQKYDDCIEHCDKILESETNKEVTELKNTAMKRKLIEDRDKRKNAKKSSKVSAEKALIKKTVLERGIKISNCEDEKDFDLSKLEPTVPCTEECMVHIEDGVLKWPVLFMYPESQLTDFLKGCPENVDLLTQLQMVFPAPWDFSRKYNKLSVNVYFEGYDKMPHVVDPRDTLGEIMLMRYFELRAGTPAFFVLLRGSEAEKMFLRNYM